MDAYEDQHVPLSPQYIFKQNKTTDLVELLRWIGGIVKYILSFMELRWLTKLARECFPLALIML